MQNGVRRCCVIFICFSFQFESKSVCLIGRLFSNFYVVHGSYMIKEKYRKNTGVIFYVLIFLSASGLRVKQVVYVLTFLSARNFCAMCLMAKLASTL